MQCLGANSMPGECCNLSDEDILQALQMHLDLDDFREGQLDAIRSILKPSDTLLILPTGGGKSLAYQLSPFLRKGISFVVSPLISLISDQQRRLNKLKIKAVSLNSSIPQRVHNEIFSRLSLVCTSDDVEEIPIVFITPEQLQKESFKKILRELYLAKKIGLFAIDEAHCISSWGHDFRQSYRKLGRLKEDFPEVPILACTATATEVVRKDIIAVLNLKNPQKIIKSFNRENLTYSVKDLETLEIDRDEDLAAEVSAFCANEEGCGIVYCFKKTTCEEVSNYLRGKGLAADCYHAGLRETRRGEIQSRWNEGKIKVLVATIAFGMGIDKQDVRFVIHHSIPNSMEGYYQESGRAGRDGKQAWCILYYSADDFAQRHFINEMNETRKDGIARAPKSLLDRNASLKHVKAYCETPVCRRVQILRFFGELPPSSNIQPASGSIGDFYWGEKSECCDVCCDPGKSRKIADQRLRNSVLESRQKKSGKFRILPKKRALEFSYEYDKEPDLGDEGDRTVSTVKAFKPQSQFKSPRSLLTGAESARLTNSTSSFSSNISQGIRNKGLGAVLDELEKQEDEILEANSSQKLTLLRRKFVVPFKRSLGAKIVPTSTTSPKL